MCLGWLRAVQAHAYYSCVDGELIMSPFTSKRGQELIQWSIATLPSQFIDCFIPRDCHSHCTPVLTCPLVTFWPCHSEPSFFWHWKCKHLSLAITSLLLTASPIFSYSYFFFFTRIPYLSWHILSIILVIIPLVPLAWHLTRPENFQCTRIHHQPSQDWPGLSRDSGQPHTIKVWGH